MELRPISTLPGTGPTQTNNSGEDIKTLLASISDRLVKMENRGTGPAKHTAAGPKNGASSHPRTSNQPTNAGAPTDDHTRTLLASLMERLDRIEERVTRQTPKPTPTPSTDTGTRNLEANRSTNPQFNELWRNIFRGVQLKHHLRNWQTLPPSIEKNLKDLAGQIHPPMPTPETAEIISTIMEVAGLNIKSTIQDHLNDSIVANHQLRSTLDHTDLPKAAEIATKHLRRRLGKKIQNQQLEEWIQEEITLTNTPAITNPPTPPTNTDTTPPTLPTNTDKNPTQPMEQRVAVTSARGPRLNKRRRLESKSPTFAKRPNQHPEEADDEEGTTGINKQPSTSRKTTATKLPRIILERSDAHHTSPPRMDEEERVEGSTDTETESSGMQYSTLRALNPTPAGTERGGPKGTSPPQTTEVKNKNNKKNSSM